MNEHGNAAWRPRLCLLAFSKSGDFRGMTVAEKPIEFKSSASVMALSQSFRSVGDDFNRKLSHKLGGWRGGYGTPAAADDPFAGLDAAPVPTFKALCSIESRMDPNQERSFPPVWHLYVYDQGTHRDVLLVGVSSMLGGGTSMRRYLPKFHEALMKA